MACFTAPAAEAIVTAIVKKHVSDTAEPGKVSWSRKLGWLTNMLWGGSILLALEHIWHGEIVFHPPFLTAMYNAADTAEMLHEIATVGVGMAALVTAVWAAACLVIDHVPALRSALAADKA